MTLAATDPPPAPAARQRALHSLRAYKLAQLLRHFARGARTLRRDFHGMDTAQKRQAIQCWARDVLHSLQVSVESQGAAPRQEPALVVANHLSWLDILVIQTLMPGLFVAKSEVRRWPLIGPLAQASHTIFVDRRSARSAHAMVEHSVLALQQGWCVVAFPEGTSSDGSELGRFHANIFECAVRSGMPVQTLSLQYVHRDHATIAHEAHFTGSTTLLASLLRVSGSSSLHARVHLGDRIAVQGHTRKTLARQAHQQMCAQLQTG